MNTTPAGWVASFVAEHEALHKGNLACDQLFQPNFLLSRINYHPKRLVDGLREFNTGLVRGNRVIAQEIKN